MCTLRYRGVVLVPVLAPPLEGLPLGKVAIVVSRGWSIRRIMDLIDDLFFNERSTSATQP
jgi:hypothetical protein